MKRILYCLMTLLILGLTTLPCAADSNKDIEARVSKMTEAEMREELHNAEAHLAELEKALERMQREQVRRLPVTQDGRLVGMLSIADIARGGRRAAETAEALSHITSNVCRK